MIKLIIKILIVLIFVDISYRPCYSEEVTGGILEGKVNSNYEDYNSYIIFNKDTDTLFFTSSRPVKNKDYVKALEAEMFYCTRPASFRLSDKAPNIGWSESKQIVVQDKHLKGYTRGSQVLSEDRIIFAAERDISSGSSAGTSYLLDLWQMIKISDGFSNPEPLGAVNDPDAWDSQPALSGDGKILYFVSNRKGGKGGLDIWFSVQDDRGNWTEAELVPNINTPGDEISPCCGTDGNFYFSSNWDYDNNIKRNNKDIYRTQYITINENQLPGKPINLDIAMKIDAGKYGLTIPQSIKYNSEADDEFPFITLDRKTIFLTSNRQSDFSQRNLYAFSLPKSKIRLQVNVKEQEFDANGDLIVPPTTKLGLSLTLIDSSEGTSQDIKSGEQYEVDPDKVYIVKFSKFVRDECYQNKIEDNNFEAHNTIKTFRPFGLDTLFQKDFLISRRKINIDPIIFKASEKLPFFITGYWYPNTNRNLQEFRKREASGFFNQSGFVDSSDYDYENTSRIIDQIFDERLFKPLEKILPSFQDFCRDTLYLKVTIHGYTDPRGLSGGEDHKYRPQSKYKHNYTDDTVEVGLDERGNPVTIYQGIDMWKQSWPKNPDNRNGVWIKLPDEGENGNVLLSKLRAYYTFKTFNDVMSERSSIYKQLTLNNRIICDAEGFGIDKEGFEVRKLKDDPESRRIEIYLDILRPEEIKSHHRLKGGNLAGKKISESKSNNEINENTSSKIPLNQVKEEKNTEKNTVPLNKEEEIKKVNVEALTEESTKQKITEKITVKDTPVQKEVKTTECYSIQYSAYSDENEANKALVILKENGLPDPKIVIYIDPIGNILYRVRAGCYSTGEEALTNMKKNSWIHKELNLTKSPVIVK